MKTTYSTFQTQKLPQLQQSSISVAKLLLIVAVLTITGIVLVLRFSFSEEQRELVRWQNKLGLIADSRVEDVDAWLDMHFHELGAVASNPSLQLYVTTLENPKKDVAPVMAQPAIPSLGLPATMAEEPAEVGILRSLLISTADRMGFLGKVPDEVKTIQANMPHPKGTGLAILDMNGKVLVATEGLSAVNPAVATKIAAAPKGQASLIDAFEEDGHTRIGFVLPIYPIQGDATAAQQIAVLVGVKNMGDDFARLLVQPGATEKTLEAILVHKVDNNVEYINPAPQKDEKPLSAQFALNTPDLDAAFALNNPGAFSLKRDRLSHRVLMISRPVANTPWVLLLHIDRNQAMAESDSWRNKMVFIMFFALLAMIAFIVAAWWYGASRRALLLSEQTGKLASHSLAQEKLLRLVTDNQPEPIFITDARGIVRFANEKTGKLFGVAVNDVIGKDLPALMGPAMASGYLEANKSALAIHKALGRTHRMGEGANARILNSEHIPLAHIPIDGLGYPSPGVLVVDQDVTDIVNERERRERTLAQLIRTLVRMVDARDPFAANHSASVALIAREVATGLALEHALVDTAQTAGNLMNIGKIVVSSQILTKTSALDNDEIQAIRESLQKSADLLQGIDFDGPVVDTLRQAGEHYDGSGPLKLRGENILITARIIAVANAFVGMISPRSYRAAITMEKAATLLLKNIDTQFDRRVVVALINFVENQEGKALLSELVKKAG